MGSSVEIFDTATLEHVDSRSLGLIDEGSITWFDRYRGGFIAGFAHYDGPNGLPSRITALERGHLRRGVAPHRRLAAAPTALERMAPYAASGGAIGPDGWLYLLGHDRPEMYVAGRPSMGPVLIHVATIDLEAEGQAFSWAQDGTRTVFTIDRRKGLVRTIEIPPIVDPGPAHAMPFR